MTAPDHPARTRAAHTQNGDTVSVTPTGSLPPRQEVQPPDPKPARRLRLRLAVLRTEGVDFDTAWEEATRFALTGVDGRAVRSWRASFDWSRAEWRLAYERQPPLRRLGVCESGDLRGG